MSVHLLLSLPYQTLLFHLDWLLKLTELFGASTLFAQTNTCSLVAAVFSLPLVSYLIISTRISLSLNLCMNYSLNCLSISL